MKLEALADECKGITVTGTISYIIDRMERDGKDGKWHTQFIVLKNITGSVKNAVTGEEITLESEGIGVNLKNCVEITKKGVGLTVEDATIGSYEKKGVIKRSLSVSKIKTTVIPNEEPEDEASLIEDPEAPNVWAEKDLRIARENSNQHATALVCKYFKGSLEEATAQVILISNMLVDSVYMELEYPIKQKTTKKEELLADIKAGSDQNVLEIKCHEYKKELAEVSDSEAIYYALLADINLKAEHANELSVEEQAKFATALASEIKAHKKY